MTQRIVLNWISHADDTLRAFGLLGNKSDLLTIKTFVDDYFLPPGTELQRCHPSDWTAKPKDFDKIKDPVYRKWAFDLHSKWRSLCRKVSKHAEFGQLFTFLILSNKSNKT